MDDGWHTATNSVVTKKKTGCGGRETERTCHVAFVGLLALTYPSVRRQGFLLQDIFYIPRTSFRSSTNIIIQAG
jgi:hypothetical protein